MTDTIRIHPEGKVNGLPTEYIDNIPESVVQAEIEDRRSIIQKKQKQLDETSASLVPEEEDLYEVKFSKKQALVGFAVSFGHAVFGPAIIPILVWAFKPPLVKNMFIRWSFVYVQTELSQWLWVVAALYLSLTAGERSIYVYPMATTAGVVVVLRAMLVSLKYGFFTQTEWNRLKTKVLTTEEVNQTLLIRIWIRVPDNIAYRELDQSFKRLGVNPDTSELSFISGSGELRSFHLSMRSLAKRMLDQARSTSSPKEIVLVMLACMIYTVSPILVIYSEAGNLDLTAMEWMFMVQTLMTGFFCSVGFALLTFVAVYDFSRRKVLQSYCTQLLDTADSDHIFLSGTDYRLNIGDSENILAWYYLRMALLDFGRRLTNRLLLYVSLILPLCVAAIVLIYLMVFGVVAQSLLFLMTPVIWLIVIELAILFYVVTAAIALNKQFAIHRDMLLWHIAQLATNSYAASESSISSMWIVIEKLYQDEAIKPVKILGFKINSSIYSQLLTVVASAVFALYQLLTG